MAAKQKYNRVFQIQVFWAVGVTRQWHQNSNQHQFSKNKSPGFVRRVCKLGWELDQKSQINRNL